MTTEHHNERRYIPAAGHRRLLAFYDPLLALLTREKRWRRRILAPLSLTAGDVLVDVGCGTGTLAVMAKQAVANARVIGIDPDPEALERAERKAGRRRVTVDFNHGFGRDTARLVGAGRADKIVSSLAFHHMDDTARRETLASMYEALKPGGLIAVADFTSGHMAAGHGATPPDLVREMTEAGFGNVAARDSFRTFFGTVGVFCGVK